MRYIPGLAEEKVMILYRSMNKQNYPGAKRSQGTRGKLVARQQGSSP